MGGTLGHEQSVGVGFAEQQLNSAMQQLGMSDGECCHCVASDITCRGGETQGGRVWLSWQ